MRNVTVTLDDETARWARIEAAKRDMSLSALLRDLLREQIERQDAYEAAMRSYFAARPKRLRGKGQPLPKREELYDRGRLR